MPELTADRLRTMFHYDPETGAFTRRIGIQNHPAGKVAGSLDGKGYWSVGIDRKQYLVHRLVWLYVYGEWPTRDLDHKDTVRTNNRLSNLRLATASQNMGNRPPIRKIGKKGVRKDRRTGRYQARCQGRYLGMFDSEDEAHAAYMAAAREAYGEFARAS